MFKNLKLSTKLLGGFGIVLALVVGVIGVYQYAVGNMTTNFQGLMDGELAIANHAAEVNLLTLQCRRDEKNFLVRKEMKYVENVEKNVAALIKEAEAIIKLARQLDKDEEAAQATAIIGYAREYLNNFKALVASHETRGLDNDSGLQGKFRAIVRSLEKRLAQHEVDDLYVAMLEIRRYEKEYARTRSAEFKQKFMSAMDTYRQLLEESSCEPNAKRAQEVALAAYRDAFDKYVTASGMNTYEEQHYEAMRTAARSMEQALKNVYVPAAGAMVLKIRKYEKNYLMGWDQEEYLKKTHMAIEKLAASFRGAGILKEFVATTEADLKAYKETFDAVVAEDSTIATLDIAMRDTVNKIEPAAEKLYKQGMQAADAKTEKTTSDANFQTRLAMGVGIGAVVLGLFLAFFISRSITKPINRVIEGLSEGSEQVTSASQEVSSASQQLAEGSSEQAASLEETSSSLEEMASMTKQNAGNANEANQLMKEANQVVGTANKSMHDLTESMQEISQASAETSKIIKTIDEIAFQTNLLALNAAVEAARAGEAGAGFAVVADEVRNLAMRAAEAARNTADLIEGTVKKVEQGSELVTKTNDAFTEVARSTGRVGELLGEITAASNEQATGIAQVNTAVSEMDKVVQQNAANAEESASASEELNAQAEQMKMFVQDLVALVGGKAGSGNGRVVKVGRGRRLQPAAPIPGPAPGGNGTARTRKSQTPHEKPAGIPPEEVIPFEEESFDHF